MLSFVVIESYAVRVMKLDMAGSAKPKSLMHAQLAAVPAPYLFRIPGMLLVAVNAHAFSMMLPALIALAANNNLAIIF